MVNIQFIMRSEGMKYTKRLFVSGFSVLQPQISKQIVTMRISKLHNKLTNHHKQLKTKHIVLYIIQQVKNTQQLHIVVRVAMPLNILLQLMTKVIMKWVHHI